LQGESNDNVTTRIAIRFILTLIAIEPLHQLNKETRCAVRDKWPTSFNAVNRTCR
jgi:hypothetical protein